MRVPAAICNALIYNVILSEAKDLCRGDPSPSCAAQDDAVARVGLYSVKRLRISSPVAGALIFGMAPLDTKESAFLIAMKTEMPRSRGGSPTALLDRMLTVFASLSIVSTLKISGRS